MTRVLQANTTVTFRDPEDEGKTIRLERDTERPVESKTYYTAPYRVSAQDKTHVRLYHGPNVDPQVFAVTGSMTEIGTGVEKGVIETVTITPDSPTASIPPWATNVTVRIVGRSFTATGASARPTLAYDSVRKTVTAGSSVYAAIEVKFDAPYRLFLYTFTGTCPLNPPKDFDNEGNEITDRPKTFSDGVVFAIDFNKNANATLVMDGPECSWGGAGGVTGTESDRVLPRLSMDIHPDYPVRLVSSVDGNSVWCECTVRVFPASAGAEVFTTSGSASATTKKETMPVKDILSFDGRSSQSLSYTPVGAVALATLNLYPIRDRYRRYSEGRAINPTGPGSEVIDVDLSDTGLGYSNPRPRQLGPDEVALVDLYGVPSPSLAVVEAEYTTSYDCFVFSFEWDGVKGAWKEAILLAKTPDGRVARLEVSPPSTKSRNRKFANE